MELHLTVNAKLRCSFQFLFAKMVALMQIYLGKRIFASSFNFSFVHILTFSC
uniref:Uncharacterized protein n=1 Tax=Rhizophora mucronata TaxID=61149 RepID=A0A2P2PNJ3_RHIMU